MNFGNFGKISFTTKSRLAPFVDYLMEGKFMATKCGLCERSFFPPRHDCPYCMSNDIEWFEITGFGKLLSYTTVYYGPSGFEDATPYTLAIVRFEQDIKVLGHISKEFDQKDIKLGMNLKIAPVKLDSERISYQFEP